MEWVSTIALRSVCRCKCSLMVVIAFWAGIEWNITIRDGASQQIDRPFSCWGCHTTNCKTKGKSDANQSIRSLPVSQDTLSTSYVVQLIVKDWLILGFHQPLQRFHAQFCLNRILDPHLGVLKEFLTHENVVVKSEET